MKPARLLATAARGVGCAAVLIAASVALAQDTGQHDFDLPAQALGTSLRAVALASGRNLVAPTSLLDGKQAPALTGRYTADQAIAILLQGTGLHTIVVGQSLVIKPADSPAVPERAATTDIVVTGTRIRGAGPVGSSVITIDRAEIDRSGYATTQQILQSLPQNFGGGPNEGSVGVSVRNNASANAGFGSSVNLRGLGTTSTLVLIDGNRPALGGLFGAFSDLSLIPSSAIDRIEVLADGASALYGSDAVAGVVNIKLRNDFDGAETRARYGVANGFDEAQISLLFGRHWSTGHLVIGYEYYQRGRLPASDRAYATEDLRPFGGPDYRKDFSNPGTIIAADGRTFAIPAGQDGSNLTAGALLADQTNLADGRANTDLLPDTRRHAAYAALDQSLGGSIRLTAQGFFADRVSSTRFIPDNYGGVVVPVTNPFYVDPIGTGQPVMVNYDFTKDLGPQTATTHVRAYSGVAGLEATRDAWSAEVHGSYGAQTEALRSENIPNYVRLAAALADPDPATAYNLFGDGSFTNPATIARVRGSVDSLGRYSVLSTTFKVDGPLFRLPAGVVKLAFGGEFRREHYAYDTIDDQFSATPQSIATSGLPISRTVVAGFAELLVPVVAPSQGVPGITKLDLSLAGRIERYDSFGTTANPKFGLGWTPVEGMVLRSSFGTSFRAPSFQDVRQGPGTGQFIPIPLPDPASPTGTTNALLLFGNRPGIGPEKAWTWTVGIDLRPAAVAGAHLTLTYFDIRYRDRIANISTDFFTFLTDRSRYAPLINNAPTPALIATLYQDPTFINPYGIAQGNIAVVIDGRTANLSSVTESGLDFDLGYTVRRGTVSVEAGLSGAYLFHLDQAITATSPAVNVVSTIGNPVDLRLRGRLTATYGRWNLAAFVNFIDGYRNTAVTPAETVHSWTTVDTQIGYDLPLRRGPLAGTRLALSVSNLFNRAPPYVNNPTSFSAIGYDADNASPVGRLVAFQVIKPW